MKIKKIIARKILDSLGNDAIEVIINKKYSCSAPNEIIKENHSFYPYKNDLNDTINSINNSKQLKKIEINNFSDLYYLDNLRDELGANGIYALHGAILKALSNNEVWKFLNSHPDKMPIPIGNCIGGSIDGRNNVDFREFLVIPKTMDFTDGVFANEYVYKRIGDELKIKEKNYQGAWAPNLDTISILNLLSKNVESASNTIGFELKIGININSNHLFNNDKYKYNNFSYFKKDNILTRDEHIEFINSIIKDFKISYVEDPLDENDFEGYEKIKSKIVSVNNPVCCSIERLNKFKGKINAVVIKPSQIGSLTLLKEFIDYAKKENIITILSCMTGETMDDLISHLAVGWEIPFIKCGIYEKERISKIKTLKKIEKEIRS